MTKSTHSDSPEKSEKIEGDSLIQLLRGQSGDKLITSSNTASNRSKKMEAEHQGDQALLQSDFEKAIAFYKQSGINVWRLEEKIGYCHNMLEEHADAVEYLKDAPKHSSVIGSCLLVQSRHRAAKHRFDSVLTSENSELLDKAIQLPDQISWIYEIVDQCYGYGEKYNDRKLEIYKQGITRFPKYSHVKYLYVKTARACGYETDEKCYDLLLSGLEKEADLEYLWELSALAHTINKFKEAMHYFEQVENGVQEPDGRLMLKVLKADRYLAMDNLPKADALYTSILKNLEDRNSTISDDTALERKNKEISLAALRGRVVVALKSKKEDDIQNHISLLLTLATFENQSNLRASVIEGEPEGVLHSNWEIPGPDLTGFLGPTQFGVAPVNKRFGSFLLNASGVS